MTLSTPSHPSCNGLCFPSFTIPFVPADPRGGSPGLPSDLAGAGTEDATLEQTWCILSQLLSTPSRIQRSDPSVFRCLDGVGFRSQVMTTPWGGFGGAGKDPVSNTCVTSRRS